MFKNIFLGKKPPALDESSSTRVLSASEIAEIARDCYFSEAEVRKLHERFSSLLDNDQEALSVEDFFLQPEAANCRLIVLAVDYLCPPGSSSGLSFSEYVLLLSKFRWFELTWIISFLQLYLLLDMTPQTVLY